MKTIKLTIMTFFILILCQGCSSKNPGSTAQSRAKLVDLGNGICSQSNGLQWQISRSENFSSFEEAREYVEDLDLGGHNDWRFPTRDELYVLCELFELKFSGDCPIKSEGSYWSKNGKVKSGEWFAYPLCGGSDFRYLKSTTGRVRAVRP